MKKEIISTLILTILIIPGVLACLNSVDNYATEVVLNNPGASFDLSQLDKARNIVRSSDTYIFQSNYNQNLATVLSLVSEPVCQENCLSVRLQILTTTLTRNIDYFKFVSSSAPGKLTISDTDMYNYWGIQCEKTLTTPSQCEFKKENTNILVYQVSDTYEVEIEITEKLKSCTDCDGWCAINQNLCIDKKQKDDIEDILKFAGVISSFTDLIYSYRVLGEGEKIIQDLQPLSSPDIDWQEAMRQQLVWLRRNNILLISNADIEKIAKLSEAGKAGQNSRIVFSEEDNNWIYYSDSDYSILTKIRNCQEFPKSLMPVNEVYFSGMINTYYFIPLIISISLIVALVVLVLIAHLIRKAKTKKSKKKRKVKSKFKTKKKSKS